jgi:23S rRNA pseudouridine1911/1915/1917 synthase
MWSRSRIKRGLLSLALDGKAAKLSDRVKKGMLLELTYRDTAPLENAEAEEIPLDIVYEDEEIIVINKPHGMATHPSAGIYGGTLVNALLGHCAHLPSAPEMGVRPGIVHRLDKDTSGLILCAKTDRAQEALSRAFHERRVTKIYSAIVRGRLSPRQGIIDAPVARDPLHRTRQAVIEGGRSAQTGYQVIEEFSGHSYLQLQLFTGRTHQIRVHLAHIKHPIVGDPVYGRSDTLSALLCLAATQLGFTHPAREQELSFSIPLPGHMREALNGLRQKNQ